MGSRSIERGNQALNTLIAENKDMEGKIETVQLDVSNQDSIMLALTMLNDNLGSDKLYALVNNAGVMGNTNDVSKEDVIQTNL